MYIFPSIHICFYPASVGDMEFGKILRRTLKFQWLSAGHTVYAVSPPDWNTRSPVEAGGKEMEEGEREGRREGMR